MSVEALTADRLDIADLFTRFANLLDERRWDDAGTIYTGDAVVHSARVGEIRGLATIVDFMRKSEVEGQRTLHTTTDLLVDLDGDQAATSAKSIVYHYRDGEPPHFTGGLRMFGTAVRTPDGWRIREIRIAPAWTREN